MRRPMNLQNWPALHNAPPIKYLLRGTTRTFGCARCTRGCVRSTRSCARVKPDPSHQRSRVVGHYRQLPKRRRVGRPCRGEVPLATHSKLLYHRQLTVQRGRLHPFLRCVSQSEGQALLQEIHQGHYGAYQAPRGLVARAFRQGLYWPTALHDVQDIIQHCHGCQWIGCSSKALSTPLQLLPPIWPFTR